MRIVIVATYAPPLKGGRQRDAVVLARGLRLAGHQASIVAQFGSSKPPLRERFTRCENERAFLHEEITVSIVKPSRLLQLMGSLVYAMIWIPQLHQTAASILGSAFRQSLSSSIRNADIVHYLGTGAEPLGFAARSAARAFGAAFLVQPAIHPGRWGDRAIDAKLYRGSDAVLAFTRSEASVIRQLGVPAERVHIVPGSSDSPPVNTDPKGFRGRYGIKGPLVVFLGRKTEEKGVGRLIDAWPSVCSQFPNSTLVFIGPGRITVRDQHVRSIIDIIGATEQEKHDALAACDIFCLPSLAESFGIAVFEALAHGKPVVVGDVPALRESIEQIGCGLLVRPNPCDIAGALLQLIRDPARCKEMGSRALSLAACHTNEHALKIYLDIYAQVSRKSAR